MLPHDAGFPEPHSTPPPGRRETPPVAGRIEPAAAAEAAPPPPALSSGPELGALLQALRRRWAAALLLGGTLATAAALAAWFLMSPKYTAFSQVRVLYEPDKPFNDRLASAGNFKTVLQTQASSIKSWPIIEAALRREEIKGVNLSDRERDPAYIQEELKVEFQETSELLTILFGASDPAVATALVKAITAAYMDVVVDAEKKVQTDRVAELEKAYTEANNTLNAKRRALEKLGERMKTQDPSVIAQQQMERMQSLQFSKQQWIQTRTERLKAEADLNAHDERMRALEKMPVPEHALQAAVDADPICKRWEERIERFETIAKRYARGAVNPQLELTYIRAKEEVAELQQDLEKRHAELRAKLKRQAEGGARDDLALARVQKVRIVKSLQEFEAKLDEEVKDLARQVVKIGKAAPDIVSLQGEIQHQEEVVRELDMKLQREKVNLRAADRITVWQPADLQKKDMKKQVLATVAAPLAVLFAVCMSLAWVECRQRRVRSAAEVSRGLGIRVVGAVPELHDLERHLVGPTGEADLEGHPVLESIDALRTLVLHDAEANATRVVMVTSATTGEGKTTLAGHLASSLARAGRKTLLIDGDLRRPSAHQLFELPMQPGFSEVLLGEVEMTDALQPTTLDGLWLMAAGQWDREVLQALARDGLEGILEKLQEEFDFLVVDSHPVLPATDSLLIGKQVDAVILSVLREVSQMPRVYAASQRLTSLGIRVLGAVVNGTDPEEVFAAPANAPTAASA